MENSRLLIIELKLVDDCPGFYVLDAIFQPRNCETAITWLEDKKYLGIVSIHNMFIPCADMKSIKGAEYSVKSGAPPTEPCGTPQGELCVDETLAPMLTICDRPCK